MVDTSAMTQGSVPSMTGFLVTQTSPVKAIEFL
jgi:hypothetical protein